MTSNNQFHAELLQLKKKALENKWLVACLCAAWCDTCEAYRTPFETLMSQHLDKSFVWVDIEDHAALVDELEIDNFPTILIECDQRVVFFGTMLPDTSQLHRLLVSLQTSADDLAQSSARAAAVPIGWSLQKKLAEFT
jgi:thioredoxin 1